MSETLVIQRPLQPAGQLVLLFHGVGGQPGDMLPLGRRLAGAFPQACIVSVPGAQPCDLGAGRQWFSVRGISEDNRGQQVAQALPAFLAQVRQWQDRSGVAAEATALVGFSQGAIMALEATRQGPVAAGRVVAIAGRFAQLPEAAPAAATLHLVHGKADAVIPYVHCVLAAERLVHLGADVTADVLPFVGHAIPAEVEELVVHRLTHHVPQRHWQAALGAAPAMARLRTVRPPGAWSGPRQSRAADGGSRPG